MSEIVKDISKVLPQNRPIFRGHAILTTEHLNYFKPIRTPDEVIKGSVLNKETITCNPLTGKVEVEGYVFVYKGYKKVYYTKPYRVWTLNKLARKTIKDLFQSDEEITHIVSLNSYIDPKHDIKNQYGIPVSIKESLIDLSTIEATYEPMNVDLYSTEGSIHAESIITIKDYIGNYEHSNNFFARSRDILAPINISYSGFNVPSNGALKYDNGQLINYRLQLTQNGVNYPFSDNGIDFSTQTREPFYSFKYKYSFIPKDNNIVEFYEKCLDKTAYKTIDKYPLEDNLIDIYTGDSSKWPVRKFTFPDKSELDLFNSNVELPNNSSIKWMQFATVKNGSVGTIYPNIRNNNLDKVFGKLYQKSTITVKANKLPEVLPDEIIDTRTTQYDIKLAPPVYIGGNSLALGDVYKASLVFLRDDNGLNFANKHATNPKIEALFRPTSIKNFIAINNDENIQDTFQSTSKLFIDMLAHAHYFTFDDGNYYENEPLYSVKNAFNFIYNCCIQLMFNYKVYITEIDNSHTGINYFDTPYPETIGYYNVKTPKTVIKDNKCYITDDDGVILSSELDSMNYNKYPILKTDKYGSIFKKMSPMLFHMAPFVCKKIEFKSHNKIVSVDNEYSNPNIDFDDEKTKSRYMRIDADTNGDLHVSSAVIKYNQNITLTVNKHSSLSNSNKNLEGNYYFNDDIAKVLGVKYIYQESA